MKYKAKPVIVDAYRFDEDYEFTGPKWLGKAIDSGAICIDRVLKDGVMSVYGCTVQYKGGRISIRTGDYIVRDKGGGLKTMSKKEFLACYEPL